LVTVEKLDRDDRILGPSVRVGLPLPSEDEFFGRANLQVLPDSDVIRVALAHLDPIAPSGPDFQNWDLRQELVRRREPAF
jgi:hypothetical protein